MKRIIILGIVVFLVMAGWSVAWFVASGKIREAVLALAEADGQSTPKLTCARLDVGGYPFWFDVVCTGATLVSGDITATTAQAKATTLAYNPTQVLAVAKSPLEVSDAFTGSRQRLDWSRLEASGRLTGWRIARISVIMDKPVLDDTVAGATLLAKASHVEAHLIDIPGQYDASKGLASLALYLKAEHLDAPGFQVNDANSSLSAEITNLPDDVRTYADPNLLRRWRAAGGKLTLVDFSGADGATNFKVAGTLALDASAKPAGQLTIQSKGLVERFGGLVPQQWRAVVLGTPDASGNYHQVLNFTNGLVFSGVLPLAPLPALD